MVNMERAAQEEAGWELHEGGGKATLLLPVVSFVLLRPSYQIPEYRCWPAGVQLIVFKP